MYLISLEGLTVVKLNTIDAGKIYNIMALINYYIIFSLNLGNKSSVFKCQ
jgi:hypothetical protein